ncbi:MULTISPECIES: heme exporter protein CcmB [unclassified Marinobacterium]|jgi:heme exporter protein B|uniref:heme exporter protein CcmB n=1 Tax=unclassified Marinobacterium TaxID=2644139 RepID=UPI001569E60D|nr:MULTISPECIES: heme exporter protein CcmB [unclassified Marinobacterium]NRP09323.1 Heme exporter protein B [Marinobacterium sp. xm-g-48]NRP15262.1 Heme exporter protein B [Marinobacterium sp. xm-a-152]NRP26671.1 Heme exporter protein B [Marinobacterium sp. xm-d-420]NRP37679.1 Heme exporter protein B [Marinobacterium sp. xm-a-121]NRP46116.1 Heme exporter protein B [Marinobacterium sp. xm-d-543]
MSSTLQLFKQTFKRDLTLAFRRKSELVNPLIFFLIVASLFPIGVSPEPNFLSQLAPGLVWVAALLATLLSMETLFKSDYEDGSLEQLLLSPQPVFLVVLSKVLAHWLLSGLALTLVAPLLGVMLFLPSEGMPGLMLSLLLGTPTLSLIGAIGAALTVGLRRGGVLISLLVLPLYIPVLIFGSSAVQAAVTGLPLDGYLALLGAMLALALALAPIAAGAALRISVSG